MPIHTTSLALDTHRDLGGAFVSRNWVEVQCPQECMSAPLRTGELCCD